MEEPTLGIQFSDAKVMDELIKEIGHLTEEHIKVIKIHFRVDTIVPYKYAPFRIPTRIQTMQTTEGMTGTIFGIDFDIKEIEEPYALDWINPRA